MIKLEVRSKSENGFRRAGRYWGPEPVEVELEDEQAEQVMREGQLFVRRLDGLTAAAAAPPAPPPPPHTPPPFGGDADDSAPDGTLKKRK